MLSADKIKCIEEKLGYTFINKSLLSMAFTHASYTNESGEESNERLELVGDSIIGYIVVTELYNRLTIAEGELTMIKNRIVSWETLGRIVAEFDAVKYVQASYKSVIAGKILGDLYEAIVGAIYVDSGSEKVARQFIVRTLIDKSDLSRVKDYKSLLQEYLQAKRETWSYETSPNGKDFICTLTFCGESFVGEGSKKKTAEMNSAEKACKKLKIV